MNFPLCFAQPASPNLLLSKAKDSRRSNFEASCLHFILQAASYAQQTPNLMRFAFSLCLCHHAERSSVRAMDEGAGLLFPIEHRIWICHQEKNFAPQITRQGSRILLYSVLLS